MTKEQAVIGTRILYRVDHENLPGLQEGKVREVTPGGNVKVGERWHRLEQVNVVETLEAGHAEARGERGSEGRRAGIGSGEELRGYEVSKSKSKSKSR